MARFGLQKDSGSVERDLAQLVSRATNHARLVLWYFDYGGCLLPAVYCPDASTALFAHATFKLKEALENRAFCRWCGNVFKQSRPNQKDCSSAHGAAYRMAKKRKKEQRTKN